MTYPRPDDLPDLCDAALRQYLLRLAAGDFYDVLQGAHGSETAVPLATTVETLRRLKKDLNPTEQSIQVQIKDSRSLLDQMNDQIKEGDL